MASACSDLSGESGPLPLYHTGPKYSHLAYLGRIREVLPPLAAQPFYTKVFLLLWAKVHVCHAHWLLVHNSSKSMLLELDTFASAIFSTWLMHMRIRCTATRGLLSRFYRLAN